MAYTEDEVEVAMLNDLPERLASELLGSEKLIITDRDGNNAWTISLLTLREYLGISNA